MVDEGGVDGVLDYLRWAVDEAGSFEGFLERVGVTELLEQRRRARELVP